MDTASNIKTGSCTCGIARYQVTAEPLIVHGCHCRDCQKNTGAAFALNALYESNRVDLLSGEVETISVPTPSGTGQDISRCKVCKAALWSNYNMGGLREHIRFIRVGTLDDPDQLPPGIHIYTRSKQPWVILPNEDKRVDVFYNIKETWSADSMKRLAKIEEAAGIKIT